MVLWVLASVAAAVALAVVLVVARSFRLRAQARYEVAREVARAEVYMLRLAVDEFAASTGRSPTDAEGLGALANQPAGLTGWRGPYLSSLPTADPWGNPYTYQRTATGYRVASNGPDGRAGTGDDVTAAGP
jgi:general secretion pathway protein G